MLTSRKQSPGWGSPTLDDSGRRRSLDAREDMRSTRGQGCGSIEVTAAMESLPLYQLYEMQHAALGPLRAAADATRLMFQNPANPLAHTLWGKSVAAGGRGRPNLIATASMKP